MKNRAVTDRSPEAFFKKPWEKKGDIKSLRDFNPLKTRDLGWGIRALSRGKVSKGAWVSLCSSP
jgi:hypothetical protein